jgi:hypothetical protein
MKKTTILMLSLVLVLFVTAPAFGQDAFDAGRLTGQAVITAATEASSVLTAKGVPYPSEKVSIPSCCYTLEELKAAAENPDAEPYLRYLAYKAGYSLTHHQPPEINYSAFSATTQLRIQQNMNK